MQPEHWLYTIPLRLRSLFRRRRADQDLEDELRDHVEQKTEQYVAKGLPLKEAAIDDKLKSQQSATFTNVSARRHQGRSRLSAGARVRCYGTFAKAESVAFNESVFGRMPGYGDVIVRGKDLTVEFLPLASLALSRFRWTERRLRPPKAWRNPSTSKRRAAAMSRPLGILYSRRRNGP
jgi:hypothetical protein